MVTRSRFAGAAAGVLLDRAVGEPPVQPHPVAVFGRVMQAIEKRWWQDDRASGVRYALAGVGTGAATGLLVRSTTVATYVSSAGRMLGDVALDVGRHLDAGDLEAARQVLPSLVGRDPTGLGEGEIARAVVESVAENTVDAVVAPAWWAAVAGAPGVLAHRAANTLDAMVGHHSDRYERFGWASARLDDALNYVPARVTATLVALVRPRTAGEVMRIVRRDASAHPSPNAGVAESAFAGALGVTLGGTNTYGTRVEHRSPMGDGRPVRVDDIARAVELSRDVGYALVLGLLSGAALFRRPGRRS
jgi:adenosylcobinamide-phosphate synthase